HAQRYGRGRVEAALRIDGTAKRCGPRLEGGVSMSEAIQPQHFGWRVEGKVATITLNWPEKKNPLTFASYGELVDTFRRLTRTPEVKVVVITGAGENFSSGGDVHEIIGPLVEMKEKMQ